MIISRTPYRISFFGGGSDYPEWYNKYHGEVLSTTIDKYLYISCRELPNFFEHNYRVCYSLIEEVKKISQIKHNVVKKALLSENFKKKLEIHYDGDLPARSGMGSSSSFVVGLLNGLSALNKVNLTKKQLSDKSVFFEQKILKEYVGSQDQVACTYGGFNFIKFRKNSINVKRIKNKNIFFKKLNKNLVLLYTGKQRVAQNIAKKFVNKLTSQKKNEIKEILNCVREAKKIIKNNSCSDFGRLLDESWNIKKKLNKDISNSTLDNIYSKGKENGAIGGKILGAGGGGFFLFYVPLKNRENFIKKMSFLTHIPFEFEESGSKIIYKGNNELL